jgi:hypothetical protein
LIVNPRANSSRIHGQAETPAPLPSYVTSEQELMS